MPGSQGQRRYLSTPDSDEHMIRPFMLISSRVEAISSTVTLFASAISSSDLKKGSHIIAMRASSSEQKCSRNCTLSLSSLFPS